MFPRHVGRMGGFFLQFSPAHWGGGGTMLGDKSLFVKIYTGARFRFTTFISMLIAFIPHARAYEMSSSRTKRLRKALAHVTPDFGNVHRPSQCEI